MNLIAGVDEAGRGPLAGPVLAAAVILSETIPLSGLKDSKQLTASKREILFHEIQATCVVGVGRAEVHEIDTLNILQATMLAMQRAVLALTVQPMLVLVDGNCCPKLPYTAKTIIKGDQTEPAISAASIVAKVLRDHEMNELDKQYQGYGFAIHKGYGTANHLAALKRLGPSAIHRRSFAPVKELITR